MAPVTNRRDAPEDRRRVFLRNEDEIEHVLSVRVASGGDLLAAESKAVASESQSALDAAWSTAAPVRIEVWADHGCAASVSLDPDASAHASTPEFIVRPSSVVVAGVN